MPQPATRAIASPGKLMRDPVEQTQGVVMAQRTLILVKPDGVRRNIIGDVISRIERKGLKVIAVEMRTIEAETAHAHYAEHAERPFFGELVDFITGGPLVALVAEGDRAVEAFRALAGATDPVKALPGTIRGD